MYNACIYNCVDCSMKKQVELTNHEFIFKVKTKKILLSKHTNKKYKR